MARREVGLLFGVAFAALLASVTAQSSIFKCKEEGRFQDPSECTSYIECIFNAEDDAFESKNKTCGKAGFDDKQKKCVPLKELGNCHPNREGRFIRVDPNYDYMCEIETGFVCGDCNTLVNCVGIKAISEPCDPEYFCQHRESFAGAAVCYPERIKKCGCMESNTFLGDPYNKKAFFFCDAYALASFYMCPGEMVYDEYAEQCVHPEGLPHCSGVGLFAHDQDCRRYYTCIQAYTGWVQKLFHCPYHQMFNERNSQCEDPCRWIRKGFTCTEEGRFPDKTDCQAFYECTMRRERDSFKLMRRMCPDGYHWQTDNYNKNKGFCISVDLSMCESHTPTSCDVPPDWCAGEGNGDFSPVPFLEDNLFDGGPEENPMTPPASEDGPTDISDENEEMTFSLTRDQEPQSMDEMGSTTLSPDPATETEPDVVNTVDSLDVSESTDTTMHYPLSETGEAKDPSFPKSNVRNLNRLLYPN